LNKIDLSGRFAVVTGGAQGWPRHHRTIRGLRRESDLGFRPGTGRKTAKEIGAAVTVLKVDVTDPATVDAARDATLKAFGRIDIRSTMQASQASTRRRPTYPMTNGGGW
jgi:3-oxoacyl-[acyl-carrier protein] reductase